MSRPTHNDAIIPPVAPIVPGLVFRPFRGQPDYVGIQKATYAAQLADGYSWLTSLEAVEREFTHLVNSDPAHDMIVAEMDGAVIGYARGQWVHVEDENTYRHWFQPWLMPAWRGHGIRRSMIRWIEQRMGEVAQEHPAGSASSLDTFMPEQAADLTALLLAEGFARVRYFDHMVRPLSDPLPDDTLPPGIELRPVQPEHYRAIWLAANEAFRDHYSHHEPDETEYEAWLSDETMFTPRLWQIAWDSATNEVAGQIRTFIAAHENQEFGRLRGYTEFISVRRPYRRQGLARALIAESLRVLRTEGMDESALTVDAENLSDATRLYADCGFVLESRTADFRKPL